MHESSSSFQIVQYLRSCELDGAVVVTTPQEVALQVRTLIASSALNISALRRMCAKRSISAAK
jgi:hypothetical protein